MEYSTIRKNARDIDAKKGIVSFYFADFNSIDSNGRKMHRNAFNRTIKNNKDRIVHLLNHDPNVIIGKPMEIATDLKGAFMVSQLSKNTAGRDALILYEEGVYNEHSFGFEILKSKDEGKFELVDEVRMWEASTVTWGANPNTPTISLNQAESLIKEGRLSDEILNKLDELLARLPAEQHQAPPEVSDIQQAINILDNY
jgi:HK97 family phage prohead protease